MEFNDIKIGEKYFYNIGGIETRPIKIIDKDNYGVDFLYTDIDHSSYGHTNYLQKITPWRRKSGYYWALDKEQKKEYPSFNAWYLMLYLDGTTNHIGDMWQKPGQEEPIPEELLQIEETMIAEAYH